MSVNNHRKCAKCGRTRAEDMTVTYHRFPYPGPSNVIKARAWAKYCWPNEDWTNMEFLQSLHTTNKVLCGRHFDSTQFYDNNRQKLSRFAVPDSTEIEEVLVDQENIFRENVKVTEQILRGPLVQIENIQTELTLAEPCTSATVQQMYVQAESTEDIQSEVMRRSISVSTSTTKQLSTTPPMKSRGILRKLNLSKLSEMTPREIKMYNFCRKNLREIVRLRKKLKNNKKNYISKICGDEHVQKLCDLKVSNSFVSLLQSQMHNCPKKPKGRRYSLEQKIMALVIYKKSPSCYRLLRRMFALPCQSSLTKLLNRVPLKPGINKHIFNSLKKMSQDHTDEENLCLLAFDEMSIRKNLYNNSNLDEIQGYQDHDNHGRSNLIATKAMVLVFMLTGLRKRWKQPIAFYFSHTLNSDRLTVILKEILTECLNANMNVVATVCDMSTVNMKALKTVGASSTDPFFMHHDREIVTILDPPHLLKCTRNLLMKHDVQCTTGVQCNEFTLKGTAKWSHIEAFYKLDSNNPIFSYAPALTDSHIYPNLKQLMKVKLAAQVFSHCVAGGILARIALNELPAEAHTTAFFISKFDELFDAVNADSPDAQKGKKFSTNLTARSPHLKLFVEMRKFISTMNYIGCKSKPPSQEGWIHTLNAIERLWKNLQRLEITSLSTRRLNQDPLENCFGCIRYNCGSNTNPTVQQFIAGIKTAIISNLRHSGQKKNCEDDISILSNNLCSFLTEVGPQQEPIHIESKLNFEELEVLISDAVEAVEQATSEGQACGYVCGYIFKRLTHHDCVQCKKALLSKHIEPIHIFTSFKEYGSSSSLKYINKNCIQCVESIAKIIHEYLKDNSWQPAVKLNVMAAADCVDFTFLKECPQHFEVNKEEIKMSTFFICLKRFLYKKNREMEDEEKRKCLQRKIRTLRNI